MSDTLRSTSSLSTTIDLETPVDHASSRSSGTGEAGRSGGGVDAVRHNQRVAVDLTRHPVITTGIIAALTGGSAVVGHVVGSHVLQHNMVVALALAGGGTLCASGLLLAFAVRIGNMPLGFVGVALAGAATCGGVFVAGMDELVRNPHRDVIVVDLQCAKIEGSGRGERCTLTRYELVDHRGRPAEVDLVTSISYDPGTALSLYRLPSGELAEYPYLAAWVHEWLRLPLIAARWVFAAHLLLVCALMIRVTRNQS